jgi:hypothetical protein
LGIIYKLEELPPLFENICGSNSQVLKKNKILDNHILQLKNEKKYLFKNFFFTKFKENTLIHFK